MQIRKVRESDLENLLELFIGGSNYHYQGRPDVFQNKTKEELRIDLIKALEESSFLVLEIDKKLGGYIAYNIKDKQQQKILWIDQLFIASEYRRCGYARQLIEEVKKVAKQDDCTRLELNCWEFNTDALALYNHLEFKTQRRILEMKM